MVTGWQAENSPLQVLIPQIPRLLGPGLNKVPFADAKPKESSGGDSFEPIFVGISEKSSKMSHDDLNKDHFDDLRHLQKI